MGRQMNNNGVDSNGEQSETDLNSDDGKWLCDAIILISETTSLIGLRFQTKINKRSELFRMRFMLLSRRLMIPLLLLLLPLLCVCVCVYLSIVVVVVAVVVSRGFGRRFQNSAIRGRRNKAVIRSGRGNSLLSQKRCLA